MIPLVLLVGYAVGAALGVIIVLTAEYVGLHLTTLGIFGVITGLAGLASVFAGFLYWGIVPEAIRNLVRAWKKGFVVIAIGKDKKAYILPAESDGYLLKPIDSKYQKYRWATDGESLHPVHNGKGLQLAIAYMGASHVVDGVMAAAATAYSQAGYETIDDLKTAEELPDPKLVEQEIERLTSLLSQIRNMDEDDVAERYGERKDILMAKINAEIRRLERIHELAVKHSGGPPVLNLGGLIIRAADVIKYFAWRTDPNLVDRIAIAETNAVLSRIGKLRQYAPYMALIVVSSVAVIAVLVVVHMLTGGTPEPSVAQQIANATVNATARVVPTGG